MRLSLVVKAIMDEIACNYQECVRGLDASTLIIMITVALTCRGSEDAGCHRSFTFHLRNPVRSSPQSLLHFEWVPMDTQWGVRLVI